MADLVSTARVTAVEVMEIFETTLDASVMNAFINSAHRFLAASMSASGLGETVLTEIEMYLAAHFAALRDKRVKSENIAGEYSAHYQVGKDGMGLESTQYGQMVLVLDTSGTLDRLNLKKASIKVF